MARKSRSALSREEARKRYIQLAELAVFEQVRVDARRLDRADDEHRVAVGPFARLNAEQVAARADGKSRGAITNLFKSQRRFQLEAMARAYEDAAVDEDGPPDPRRFDDVESWIEALASAESARGPIHEMEAAEGYALRWVLWLSQVPYGLWSEHIAEPSMREFRHSSELLEREVVRPALAHFGLEMTPPWTPLDLAGALASLVEGLWLNQCLTREHPNSPTLPAVDAARVALAMLWRGATRSARAEP
jgi:hypothetical protein